MSMNGYELVDIPVISAWLVLLFFFMKTYTNFRVQTIDYSMRNVLKT